ncbi:copper chaperone PCu(A)C [Streptomyces fragilis]|uniref:Copper chaperone PCu(A)C n=1 Tax=Streptomyces fragilis TaxID=67301 RepID=A0ABV2YD95_9ACTN|nr:copper chaperone PCu(A)C [Streptomyces fragilis]
MALAAVAALALPLSACGGQDGPDVTVEGAYMPQPVTDELAAGFLTVVNDGDRPARLTGVSSDLAARVTVHETVDGTMRPAASVDVPAGGRLTLESGGTHLMFEALTRRPVKGDTVTVELRFEDADPVTVDMPVRSATYTPSHHRH